MTSGTVEVAFDAPAFAAVAVAIMTNASGLLHFRHGSWWECQYSRRGSLIYSEISRAGVADCCGYTTPIIYIDMLLVFSRRLESRAMESVW